MFFIEIYYNYELRIMNYELNFVPLHTENDTEYRNETYSAYMPRVLR